MIFFRKLIFSLIISFLVGFTAGGVYAQECITEDIQGSCVNGECFCWSVTTTCGSSSCSAAGGACPSRDGVSISWTTGVTCNFQV